MRLRHGLPLLAFVALALMLGAGLKLNPREVPTPFIGKAAPEFSLPQLADASKLVSQGDMRGQVWVLNVWASWCAPCREEHPLLMALARDGGVPLVGLNYKDDPRNAQEWLLKLGDPYRVTAIDREGLTGINYGVYGVPESFVIDKAGIVRFKHVGPLTQQVWARDLLPLIQKLQG